MREEGRRITRTYTNKIAKLEKADRKNKKRLAEKDTVIAEKDTVIAEMASENEALRAQLAALQEKK